ncbi:hypothetical protein LX32DRAFT_315783 [Colletotrichum zoysiae]|uniref:Uncharacterized protein n=1 Tax=Colletotrichum zoysiae TaxID=1216348 RepID=A0AAD9LW27_9PEZI|nr:hypothetical protein LX32DRAFT_315783 [Colletotrichum zoysiae]
MQCIRTYLCNTFSFSLQVFISRRKEKQGKGRGGERVLFRPCFFLPHAPARLSLCSALLCSALLCSALWPSLSSVHRLFFLPLASDPFPSLPT